MQDATKVLMGATHSSSKDVSVYDSDPDTYEAGLAVRLASSGLLTLTKGSNQWVGISLGKSLSDSKMTSVARSGENVPIKATLKKASGLITIDTYANLLTNGDAIEVGGQYFIAQSSAVTPTDSTFRAATSDAATATSLANQINARTQINSVVFAVDNGDATVSVYAKAGGAAGNAITMSYTDNTTGGASIGGTVSGATFADGSDDVSDIDYATFGAKVYINDVTGMADDHLTATCTISDAIYDSAPLNGVKEDGTACAAVLVSIPGGL